MADTASVTSSEIGGQRSRVVSRFRTRNRPRVVIAGAGFGGLEAAKGLAKVDADVILIDSKNHHCFQPLLYQVATAALSPADIAWPIRHVLHDQKNVFVMMATVEAVDRQARLVITDQGAIPFDYLVIGTGASHFYFGHDEWEQYAPGLKRVEDATQIRTRILTAFERAEIARDDEERRRLLTFAVIGGGPTGVEMAGAIAEIAKQALRGDFRCIDPAHARIVLIEAGPRILPALPVDLADYAVSALQKLGVEVRTASPVTSVDPHGLNMGNERIEAETMIWAAGVVASPAAEWLKVVHDRNRRVVVNPDLSIPDSNNIFVIGDAAFLIDWKTNKQVPGVSQGALQMGRYVARVIQQDMSSNDPAQRGKLRAEGFHYKDLGSMATIGKSRAVVEIGRLRFGGFLAWCAWLALHITVLIGFRNRASVLLSWIYSYFFYGRGSRLITNFSSEQMAELSSDTMKGASTPKAAAAEKG